MNTWFWSLCAALILASVEQPAVAAGPRQVIVVSDAMRLQLALTPANAGQRIHLVHGTYAVSGPLVVPDGATLEGDGVMSGRDLPDGFEAGTETTIIPDTTAPAFAGDLLTLGNGSAIRGVTIEDVKGRIGNVVAVRSRGAGDRVSASIVRCKIINPKTPGAGPDGPLGRALAVLSQNRSLGFDPPPDENADVHVILSHSIVQSPTSSAIFAINFASHADIAIAVTANRIDGSMELTGGVSRPDEVKGASLTVRSDGNVYSSSGGTSVAWTIDGGSGAPIPGFVAPGTSHNVVRLTSIRDAIEGFPSGIAATGAKRHNTPPTSEPNSDNVVDLRLIGLELSTSVADLIFQGAAADGQYAPGDRNTLRVLMIGATGSGSRQNSYANEVAAGQTQNLGTGNELSVFGSVESFGVLNPDVIPAPPAEFFRRFGW